MQLAIIHFHLNRGGVTQVIQNHLRALGTLRPGERPERVVILFDGRRNGWPTESNLFDGEPPFPIELIEVPRLEYDQHPQADPAALAADLKQALTSRGMGTDDTLLHIHNHALGKNASLPGAIAQLAKDGYRLLLQIHDFAEDLRPANYRHLIAALSPDEPNRLAERLYPQSPEIHYAVLNSRDRAILASAGVAEAQLHRLPNPVADFPNLPASNTVRGPVDQALNLAAGDSLVVYPVRGIRRKNVGEMLLLSALDPRPATYAVTLAPLNPVERESFDRWQDLSNDLGLACRFDVGGEGKLAFHDLLAAADRLLTTSVAEGFGMVFLEAWLAGRSLVGRNLPEITADFINDGIRFPWLYDKLPVPVDWVGERAFREALSTNYRSACAAYGTTPLEDPKLNRQIDELTAAGTVDFAVLPFTLQRSVIDRVAGESSARESLLSHNAALAATLADERADADDVVNRNAAVTDRCYSPKAAGNRLAQVYTSLANSPQQSELAPLSDSRAILRAFVDVRRLVSIRLE